ncbi:hypothetical protein P5705_17815 [Pseudomonas entomophila]|uniref:hypothetical protein n=1 Tax=Pseudomonas entomophila TaxID=312306 RepID=UPI002404B221|nr:hypothetical protein [Pseudomonas entomophila]MDF9619506.1 hypothetical protein [Pseudomonas entomophila]
MRRLWRKYLDLLEADLSTKVFDNFKNLLVCALLFAAGTEAIHGDHQILLGLWVSSLSGWGLILVSAVLLLLNVSDTLHRLAKLPYHTVLQVVLCLLYLILASRVVEIVWSFRAA